MFRRISPVRYHNVNATQGNMKKTLIGIFTALFTLPVMGASSDYDRCKLDIESRYAFSYEMKQDIKKYIIN